MTDVAVPRDTRLERAEHLKERIYIAFATLAVVAALFAHDHVEPLDAFLTVLVSVLGTLLAVFTADVISHIVVHESMMTGPEFRHAASASLGALSAAVVPLAFLLTAVWGWWDVDNALLASGLALLAALMVIGFIAVRKLKLGFWQRILALGAEAVVGLLVIALQVLAKS